MITQELYDLVMQEAENIRQYATKEERQKLDIKSLDGHYFDQCIYGQMTGDCFSLRAIELLNKCAKPFTGYPEAISRPNNEKEFSEYKRDFSPIEFYILQKGANIKMLIEYIKA